MALEIARQTAATANATSPVGVEIMAEKRGAYRGEGVRSVTGSTNSAQLPLASKPGAPQRPVDVATFLRQRATIGQGSNFKATPRLLAHYERLPQMPQLAALQNLVHLLEQMDHQRAASNSNDQTLQDGSSTDPGADRSGTTQASGSLQELTQGGVQRGNGEGSGQSGQDQGRGQGQQEQGSLTTGEVFKRLQDLDPDVTHQFAALDVLREHFESSGASEAMLATLAEAAAEFEKGDLGRDVRAGFAAAQIADREAQTLETNPAAVRESYRTLLREQPNIGVVFDRLAAFDAKRDFPQVAEVFRQIAAQDLASTGPSTDPILLAALLAELGKLKKLQTTFESSGALLELVQRCIGAGESVLMSAADVASRLLNFVCKTTVSLSDARQLLGGMEELCLECQLVYANGMHALHVEVPDDVLPTLAIRLQQLTAMMSVIDDLVRREEEEHGDIQAPSAGGNAEPLLLSDQSGAVTAQR